MPSVVSCRSHFAPHADVPGFGWHLSKGAVKHYSIWQKVVLARLLRLARSCADFPGLPREPCTRRPSTGRQAAGSSGRAPPLRHMHAPRMSIHARRRAFAGILIAIASPENPVWAITTPAIIVGTPPIMASPPSHFGCVRSTSSAIQDRGETHRETRHARQPDLDLTDRESGVKESLLLRGGCRSPGHPPSTSALSRP